MLRPGINVLVVFMVFLFLQTGASAACGFAPESATTSSEVLNMPISAAISVTSGLAVGQTVYDQNIRLEKNPFAISCDNSGVFYTHYGLQTSSAELSSGSGIYPTGLAGIGIKFGFSSGGFNHVFPMTIASTVCVSVTACSYPSGFQAYSWFLLVKTGDYVQPGTIKGSDLPILTYSIGQGGKMVDIYRISMIGDIHVTVPTCDVSVASASKKVEMGKHKASEFSGIGSSAGWIDSTIQLVNCDSFTGIGKTTTGTYNGSETLINKKALSKNTFNIVLTPRNGIANGVMKLATDPLQAYGIGIQLSRMRSDSGVMNMSGSSYSYTDPLPDDGRATITVPLFARYIQTETTVVAGKANGYLEFTVDYK